MSLVYNGVNTDTVIYNGQPTTGVYNGVVIWPSSPVPEPLPDHTLRLKFRDGVTPTFNAGTGTQISTSPNIWDFSKNDGNWNYVFADQHDLLEVVGAGDTSNITSLKSTFNECTSLSSIAVFNTSNVTTIDTMFYHCYSLTGIPSFDTSNVSSMFNVFNTCSALKNVSLLNTNKVGNMSNMFISCFSLTTVPLFDTSKVTNMGSMFSNCSSLTSVPLFDTSKVSVMPYMFSNCYNVQSGALVLYQQASTQTLPPYLHAEAFANCGINTQTGSAELAQIPTSWGGTMQE